MKESMRMCCPLGSQSENLKPRQGESRKCGLIIPMGENVRRDHREHLESSGRESTRVIREISSEPLDNFFPDFIKLLSGNLTGNQLEENPSNRIIKGQRSTRPMAIT